MALAVGVGLGENPMQVPQRSSARGALFRVQRPDGFGKFPPAMIDDLLDDAAPRLGQLERDDAPIGGICAPGEVTGCVQPIGEPCHRRSDDSE